MNATQNIGGLEGLQLSLDFVNTVEWHASAHPEETLKSYGDLVHWAEGKHILTSEQVEKLSRNVSVDPDGAAAVLTRAIELREAIYRILVELAHCCIAPAEDVELLNRAIGEALCCARLVPENGGFVWAWPAEDERLDMVLRPVVWSAARLLTSGELVRVGQCADEQGCGWLFLDTSKNRTRRWCNMGDCGNRAKARRHYLKTKGS